MEWVVNATPRPLYPQERPGTHCVGGWVSPRTGLDGCGKSRPPPPGFDPRTVQPIASRCTDYAIPAHPCIKFIIIIIIIIISFMQGIYTYIPETNYVPREYSIAAILLLLFMVLMSLVSVLNLLYFYISTFRSMCAVPNMAVFCSSLTSCFPGMLLIYFLNDFEIVPVAPIITGITFVFAFHMRCISIVRSLHFRIFSDSFLIKFLSPEIATSVNVHVPFSLSRIIIIIIIIIKYALGRSVVWRINDNRPVAATLPSALLPHQSFCFWPRYC